MTDRLAGKVALITGAARGQGAAEARLFAEQGARLVLSDIREGGLEGVAQELSAKGYEVAVHPFDVADDDGWAAAVSLAEERYGRMDVLVNNAGVLDMAGIEATTRESWDRVVATNQTGVWLGMRAAAPAMRRAGGGSVVNISSIYGLIGSGGAAAYQGTKGAVRLLTKTAAIEFAPAGIRVNSIHPGFIRTPMTKHLPDNIVMAPMGRPGTPDEVATFVVFLASDASSFMTGSVLVMDGGYTLF